MRSLECLVFVHMYFVCLIKYSFMTRNNKSLKAKKRKLCPLSNFNPSSTVNSFTFNLINVTF